MEKKEFMGVRILHEHDDKGDDTTTISTNIIINIFTLAGSFKNKSKGKKAITGVRILHEHDDQGDDTTSKRYIQDGDDTT